MDILQINYTSVPPGRPDQRIPAFAGIEVAQLMEMNPSKPVSLLKPLLLSGLAILINHPPPSQKRTRHSTNPSPRERITIFTHFSRVNTDEHPSFAASAVSLSPDGSWAMPYTGAEAETAQIALERLLWKSTEVLGDVYPSS